MEDIVIIGCGGFGREVAWLIERINKAQKIWNLIGYVDDDKSIIGTKINGIEVLGTTEWLMDKTLNAVNAIGQTKIRKLVQEKIGRSDNEYPNIIAPSVIMSDLVIKGEGNIICDGSILTIDIKIGNFNIVNLDCTIGHDVKIGNYVTAYPGVHISGNVEICDTVQIGTGSNIIQGISICKNAIIGAGTTVIKNIEEEGTYVGVPAKKVK